MGVVDHLPLPLRAFRTQGERAGVRGGGALRSLPPPTLTLSPSRRGRGDRKWTPVLRLHLIAAVIVALLAAPPAHANWLTTLVEIGADAGKAGKLAGDMSVGLEGAARIIPKLPATAQKGAVAAEALEGGAWRFRNAAGDTITATGPEGVRGALTGLAPDLAASGDRLSFYLSQDAAFTGAASLDAFPDGAKLHVLVDDQPYPLLRSGKGEAARLFAEIDSNAVVAMADEKLFGEAMWQLKRPLGKSGVRVASLEAGGPKFLPGAGLRSAEGLPQAEAIDAAAFASGLSAMRGQTLIVTGQIDGEALKFTGISGASGSVPVAGLMAAARKQDVNILLLDAGTPKQPGGTTWLWQERGIAHLDKAMEQASLGDFISALGRGQGRLEIAADWGDSGHVRLTAAPARAATPAASGEAESAGIGERTLDFAAELTKSLAGQVVPSSATASLNSRDTQWDLDNRLIPGIPAWLQYWYAINWVAGLLGFSQARWWWRGITRTRAAVLSWPWRALYEAGYWLIFTPLVGPFALAAFFIWSAIEQVIGIARLLTAPFRRKQVRA